MTFCHLIILYYLFEYKSHLFYLSNKVNILIIYRRTRLQMIHLLSFQSFSVFCEVSIRTKSGESTLSTLCSQDWSRILLIFKRQLQDKILEQYWRIIVQSVVIPETSAPRSTRWVSCHMDRQSYIHMDGQTHKEF